MPNDILVKPFAALIPEMESQSEKGTEKMEIHYLKDDNGG